MAESMGADQQDAHSESPRKLIGPRGPIDEAQLIPGPEGDLTAVPPPGASGHAEAPAADGTLVIRPEDNFVAPRNPASERTGDSAPAASGRPVRSHRRPQVVPGWMSLRRWQAILASLVILGFGIGIGANDSSNSLPVISTAPAGPLGSPGLYSGPLPDGSTYSLQLPQHWNGTLFLYNHGYVDPGAPNPPTDIGDIQAGGWLLNHGYAVAGSSYKGTGFAVQDALTDQIWVIGVISKIAGHAPSSVISWGPSLGGLISIALSQQFPQQFSGALPMCGPMAGASAFWNVGLAAMVAFKALLGNGSGLQLVNIKGPDQNLALGKQLLSQAQQTPEGRARISLVAALLDIPGEFNVGSPEATTPDTQEEAQYNWLANADLSFFLDLRAELEFRAGGNASGDGGVNFTQAVLTSPNAAEVIALYQEAGLSETKDLATVAAQPVINPGKKAAGYVAKYASVSGTQPVPVLTLHTLGDGLIPVDNEWALSQSTAAAGDSSQLREVFIARAGHCSFTSAETVAAVQVLLNRLKTGTWGPTDPTTMNQLASKLPATFQANGSSDGSTPAAPAFTTGPSPYFPIPISNPASG